MMPTARVSLRLFSFLSRIMSMVVPGVLVRVDNGGRR
jgi:hypothetical protein